MNELQIKVIDTKPAVVTFNYQEISSYLEQVLDKYRGLVFTEEAISNCKKTIADLRKGQKSLDDFRKETKKKLTESVTAFENQCKLLYSKFDEVINPLSVQYEQFESDRKETKRKEIQNIIDGLIQQQGLIQKFASRLMIPDDYLNKGKSIKAIQAELMTLATTLKIQQDKEAQDVDLIKTKVELANAKYQLSYGLIDQTYISLLAYRTVSEIVETINLDAEARAKQDKEYKESIKVEPTILVLSTPVQHPMPEQVTPQSKSNATTKEFYEVEGTEAQIDALEVFLNVNKYVWNYK